MAEPISVSVTSRRLASPCSFLIGGCGILVSCAGTDGTTISGLEGAADPNPSAMARLAETYPITFTSDRAAPEGSDIFLMTVDGVTRDVTHAATLYHPSWSPSGRSIAFREQVENTYAEIGLLAPDGTERVLLTSGEETIFWLFPVNWTLDGAGVAFASRRDPETTRIWVVPREGGPSQRLFESDTTDRRELAWSPDGRRIAYGDYDRAAARHEDGIAKDVWVADATAPSVAVNLTQGRVHSPNGLQWSPDSKTIAFQAFARSANGSVEGIATHEGAGPFMAPDRETFIIDVDTGVLTRVTDDAADEEGVAWSPDGDRLLVSSALDGDFDLWLIPLQDPDQARNLIDDAGNPHDDIRPDWFHGSR